MPVERQPLSHDELRETMDLTLWAAQLLIQSGAESSVVERVVHRLATGMGSDWLDIFISPSAVTISISSGGEFRTRTRRIIAAPVNMTALAEIAALSRRSKYGQVTREQLRYELQRITTQRRAYSRGVVVIFVGLSCAAFSQLFGGDAIAFLITWIAASLAMYVRQTLSRRYFNDLLVTIVTAFVAGGVSTVLSLVSTTATPRAALAASVLLLVPGVALIGGAEDLIKGYTITGVARAVQGAIISLAIALGLILAVAVFGGEGF